MNGFYVIQKVIDRLRFYQLIDFQPYKMTGQLLATGTGEIRVYFGGIGNQTGASASPSCHLIQSHLRFLYTYNCPNSPRVRSPSSSTFASHFSRKIHSAQGGSTPPLLAGTSCFPTFALDKYRLPHPPFPAIFQH